MQATTPNLPLLNLLLCLFFYLLLPACLASKAYQPTPTQCPCAWLEKGGIWSDRRYSPFASGVYVAARCPCGPQQRSCSPRWDYGPRSLSFRWVGMHDSRDYRFQMHFCDVVVLPTLRFCNYGEAAYELRQVGTWLILQQQFCRCRLTTTEVETFTYPRPVSPLDPVFQGRFMNMTCAQRRVCETHNAVCYREPVFHDGKLRRGRVLCACPHGYFCPLYYIGGKRKAVHRNPKGPPTAYVVHCRPRWPGLMGQVRLQLPWQQG